MSEEKAVATYDPDKLMDSVKAKIRAEFTNLIPDEAWKSLVAKSVNSFFERKRNNYNSDTTPSEFERLVEMLLADDIKKRIAAFLEGPEWTSRWDPATGKQTVATAVEKIIKDNVGDIVARILGNAIQATLQQMGANIQRM